MSGEALLAAIRACDVDGRCRCGERAGHMGWLICAQLLAEGGPLPDTTKEDEDG